MIAKGRRVAIGYVLTFARAFLQFVQAFGVIAPGARRFRAGGAGLLLVSSLPFDELESDLWVRGVDGGGVITEGGFVGLRQLLSMIRYEMRVGISWTNSTQSARKQATFGLQWTKLEEARLHEDVLREMRSEEVHSLIEHCGSGG